MLAMFLLGDEFTLEQKRGELRLLRPAHHRRLVAVGLRAEHRRRRGRRARRRRCEYFRYALLMDLADVAGNVSDGVHIASAAGVWQALVFGFGGVRDFDGRLSITPHLPAAWRSLSFSLRFGDSRLRVELSHDGDRYAVEGGALDLTVSGVEHRLVPDRELSLAPSTV